MNTKTKLIFAMPGTGKTHFVKQLNKDKKDTDRPAIDYDYKGTRKPNSKEIATAQAHLFNAFAHEGVEYVFTHAGSANVDCLDPNLFDVIFIIPQEGHVDELVQRVIGRGDDPEQFFVKNYSEKGEQIRAGWIKVYNQYRKRFPSAQLIELEPGKFVSDVLSPVNHKVG